MSAWNYGGHDGSINHTKPWDSVNLHHGEFNLGLSGRKIYLKSRPKNSASLYFELMVDNGLWIWGRTHFSCTWMVECHEIFKIIRSPKNLNGGIWWLCSACSCKPSIRRSTGQSLHSQASVSGPRTWFRAFGRHESGPWQGQSSLLPPGSWYLRRVRHWSSQLQKRAYRTDLHFSSWSCLGILVAKASGSLTRCPCIGRWLSHIHNRYF